MSITHGDSMQRRFLLIDLFLMAFLFFCNLLALASRCKALVPVLPISTIRVPLTIASSSMSYPALVYNCDYTLVIKFLI
jgi:hypothetical protein